MKTLQDYNFARKKVLVRCDFNVPISQGIVLDDFRIRQALGTINYLKDQGARIVLLSHLGNPQKQKNKKQRQADCSLKPVQEKLEKLLGEPVVFSRKIIGCEARNKINRLKPGQVMLLENLRFEKGEQANDEKFALALAKTADYYVNECFASSHRKHASIVFLPKLLAPTAGFRLEKEIEVLSKVIAKPDRPLTIIIGGAKVNSKIRAIENFAAIADYILLGGKIISSILLVKGICIGKPWPDKEIVDIIGKINLTDPRFRLPIDVLASPDKSGSLYIRETGPGSVRKDEDIFDIGKETIKSFSEVIADSKTILWSGPMGYFENDKFCQGTYQIARTIAGTKTAFRIAGGGDTIAALKNFNLLQEFSFISTGGGAMLAFLAGERMPGLEALND